MLVTGEEVASALFGCPGYSMATRIHKLLSTLYCATMCLKQGMLCSLEGADTASLRLTWLEDLVGEGAMNWIKGSGTLLREGCSTVFQCGAFCSLCARLLEVLKVES